PGRNVNGQKKPFAIITEVPRTRVYSNYLSFSAQNLLAFGQISLKRQIASFCFVVNRRHISPISLSSLYNSLAITLATSPRLSCKEATATKSPNTLGNKMCISASYDLIRPLVRMLFFAAHISQAIE